MTAAGLTFYVMTAGGIVVCLLWASRRAGPPRVRDLVGLFVVLGLGGCLGIVSPVVLLGGTATAAVVTLARSQSGVAGGRCLRWGLSILAVLAGADAVGFYVHRYRPFAEWVAAAREQYPPVPRDSLLPRPAPNPLSQTEPHPGHPDFNGRLRDPRHNGFVGDSPDGWRLRNLHVTHTDFASRFARRPEFGPLRMPFLPDLRPFDLDRPAVPVLPQPRAGWMREDEALVRAGPPDDAAALAEWHAGRGIDFANADKFGLLGEIGGRGWENTAALPADTDPAGAPYLVGFEPHRSQTPPGEPLAPAWELRRVELIGLVSGDEPVAYASDELPRMGETASHHPRSLTTFERAALPKLAAGAWVVAATDPDGGGGRLRAVGALPAAAACAACHGVEKGRLLGALSYDFRRPGDAEAPADIVGAAPPP